MRLTKFCWALVLIALAGCSGSTGDVEGDESNFLANTADQVVTAVQGIGGSRVDPPLDLTPELIASLPAPALLVVAETLGTRALLGQTVRRQDGLPGTITVWRSTDEVTFAFRDGLLISTRGIGGDMLSADVGVVQSALRNAGAAGQRVYFFRTADNKQRRLSMACAVEDLGPARFGGGVLRRFQERCTGGGGEVVNEYWRDERGEIRASRQWAGPQNGYFDLRRVN